MVAPVPVVAVVVVVSSLLSEARRSRTYFGHVFVSTKYLMLAWAASNMEESKEGGISPL